MLAPVAYFADYLQAQESNAPTKNQKLTQFNDISLARAWLTYRSIRRFLRKHVITGHRHCVSLAMKALWWGNPPDKPMAPEVEFSKKEVLREEVEIYRQPDHGCLEAC
ncbi:MAG: hypothetical protein Q8K91_05640 [Hylemonella sp.]|nr:hypothetical protein [Hylemonella sp.]